MYQEVTPSAEEQTASDDRNTSTHSHTYTHTHTHRSKFESSEAELVAIVCPSLFGVWLQPVVANLLLMAEFIAFSGQGYRLDCNQVVGPEQQEIDLDSHIVRDADREGQPGQHDEDREGQLGQHDEDREGQLGQRDEVNCAQPSPTLVEGSNDESKGDAKTKEAVQADVGGLRIVAQEWVVVLENATKCGHCEGCIRESGLSILNLARKFVVDCTDLLSNMKDLDFG